MAYSDPPYIGQSKKHYKDHPDYAGEVDHTELVQRLEREYPDGWALSMSVPSLREVLDIAEIHSALKAVPNPMEEPRYRLLAWVKPFAAFKKNVRVAYAWEPLLVKVAPRLDGAIPTRDFVSCPITMKRGLTGAKPEKVCHWLFAVMGLRRTDELHDLFVGSGAVSAAWESWRMQLEVAA
jgi:hypothetical protein